MKKYYSRYIFIQYQDTAMYRREDYLFMFIYLCFLKKTVFYLNILITINCYMLMIELEARLQEIRV